MRDSDWSRQILLRSDWLGPQVAPYTTNFKGVLGFSVSSIILVTAGLMQITMQRARSAWVRF